MRGLGLFSASRMGLVAGLAAASLGVSAFADPHGGGSIVLPSSERRAPRPPRVNGKRPSTATSRGRYLGGLDDPYFGIKSRGRRGSRTRAAAMCQALASTKVGKRNMRGRITSRPFKSDGRNAAFLAALQSGKSHNAALKLARRASPDLPESARGQGRTVPAHASGGGAPRPIPNPPHRSGGAR
jgi:hypothetical protein